jgi:alpha,alpha-trehalase
LQEAVRTSNDEESVRSHGISIARGTPEDGPDRETVCGLGNRKNTYFQEELRRGGVEVYASTVDLVRAARARGLKIAVVSSSKNCESILSAAGLADLFDVRVDGNDVGNAGLRGKPEPDMFVEAARRLGVTDRKRAAVVEDAVSGVEAGRRGEFGLVIGVDRTGTPQALRQAGADVVVSDLEEVELSNNHQAGRRSSGDIPSALESLASIQERLDDRQLVVFLDYDGTLTPIVERPELAILSAEMRATVRRLAQACTVAVVSGRDRADVEHLVALDSVYYAGSHGFDITGPRDCRLQHEGGIRFQAELRQAAEELRRRIEPIAGAAVEEKSYAVAIHFRRVAPADFGAVEAAVDAVHALHPELRKTGGKMIFELRPGIDWDKGRAVQWLLDALGLDRQRTLSCYLGDDLTDEDAFAAVREDGIGILVEDEPRPTYASFRLGDTDEVRVFLDRLVALLSGKR